MAAQLVLPRRRMTLGFGKQVASPIKTRSFHSSRATQKYFDKILIANRGEISCRVQRTAKRLGIKTVAIYSEADANAKHVQMADEAVCVGPAKSADSYLNIPNVLEAIAKTKAQAVHPGYGFLSENPKFAKAIEDMGVVFLGPPSSAISALGNKIESKKLAHQAKVNIIPGRLAAVPTVEEALKLANEIGYPVMIKAVSGGGGKGMRIAWNDQDAKDGYRLARNEAVMSFGDDRLLIEKYIASPRHIEIQLLGDGQGTTLYFNERECSVQRRNQKVLEEAPSSFLDAKTRQAMGEQAVALANAVGYRSAGTAEMLVDPQRNFYFLEMNTRLQVEHPVTEYTTGYDLVELMIKVGAGEKLGIKQSDIKIKGWALESRVYAEDPFRNFLPSIGKLTTYREPTSPDGNIRCDSGVREGDDIQIHYDPMISKLITYGQNRTEAIDLMGHALDSYVIRGLNHNVSFLRAVCENPRFRSGDISTAFIPQEFPQGFQGFPLTGDQIRDFVAGTAAMNFIRQLRDESISEKQIGFKQARVRQFVVTLLGKEYKVGLNFQDDETFKVAVEGAKDPLFVEATAWPVEEPVFFADLYLGEEHFQKQEKPPSMLTFQLIDRIPGGYQLQYFGTNYDVLVQSPREHELAKFMPEKQKIDTTKMLTSPMPGRITTVSVTPGQPVAIGQELCVVEAMKMQNILRATRDCKVVKVLVKPGQDVLVDQVLVEFD